MSDSSIEIDLSDIVDGVPDLIEESDLQIITPRVSTKPMSEEVLSKLLAQERLIARVRKYGT